MRILLLFCLLLLTCSSHAHLLSRLLQAIPGVPDDIYHCNHRQDSWWLDDDGVDCNETDGDYTWAVEKLDPNEPPARCKDFDYSSYTPNNNDEDKWNSSYEPCFLWEIMYGALQPSVAPSSIVPSAAPSRSEPTEVPSTTPTTSPAPTITPTNSPSLTAAPSSAPSINLNSKMSSSFSKFRLSLVIPSTSQRRKMLRGGNDARRTLQEGDGLNNDIPTPTTLISVDRQEWQAITTNHLLKYLNAADDYLVLFLDLQFVSDSVITIDKNLGVATVTQQMGGNIYYGGDSTPSQSFIDAAIQTSFTQTPMKFEYLLLLESAQDELLANTQKVEYELIQPPPSNEFGEVSGSSVKSMNTSEIILFASIGVAVLGVVLAGIVWWKLRRANRNSAMIVMEEELKKTDTAETAQDDGQGSESRRLPQDMPHDYMYDSSHGNNDLEDDSASIATSTYSYLEDGSSIMSYQYGGTNNSTTVGRQFSYEDEGESSSLRFSMPDHYNSTNDMSLDTIKSDFVNDTSMSNLTTDTTTSNDPNKTSGVRELFGSGILGDQEEVPPPAMTASILPEEEMDESADSSYDGHLALSNYYDDKNSFCGSCGSFEEGGDSDKEDAPKETMDDDDDGVSVDVNNEEQSTSTKDQSQYGEDYSLKSAVSVASSTATEEKENGCGELDVPDVESLDDDKTEGREQDDPSD